MAAITIYTIKFYTVSELDEDSREVMDQAMLCFPEVVSLEEFQTSIRDI